MFNMYEDFSGNPLKGITPSHLTADKRQAHRFRFVLELRTVNITREGASVDEETVDTFSVVLKKLDKGPMQSKNSVVKLGCSGRNPIETSVEDPKFWTFVPHIHYQHRCAIHLFCLGMQTLNSLTHPRKQYDSRRVLRESIHINFVQRFVFILCV